MIKMDCICDRKEHSAPIEKYIIEPGAINKICETLKDYNSVYVVCDETTYEIAGARISALLKDCGKLMQVLVLGENPLPDYKTVGNIVMHLNKTSADSDIFGYSQLPDFILAVGSGTINDSCRLVSYRLGIPYGVAGTAPSMDGYASAGSPMIFDGTKATIKCTTPKYIFADIDIMSEAPYDMLLAGIGDMFGKYTGILDWELARDYNGEYYCEKIAEDVINAADLCLENGYELTTRSAGCIENIMNGLIVTGIGMAFTGNSRPASGSEHIVAHAWEIEDVKNGKTPNLHGLEVCEATRLIADMYILLYNETDDTHLKELIGKYIPYFKQIECFCEKMNVPSPVKDADAIKRSIKNALTMRDRYTILFYLRDRGLLDRYINEVTDKFVERL